MVAVTGARRGSTAIKLGDAWMHGPNKLNSEGDIRFKNNGGKIDVGLAPTCGTARILQDAGGSRSDCTLPLLLQCYCHSTT